jgi:hypothetical protein
VQKKNHINNFVLFIYILLVFFIIPTNYKIITDIVFVLFTIILIFLTVFNEIKSNNHVKYKEFFKFKDSDTIKFVSIVLIYFSVLLFSPYSITHITVNLFFLVVIVFYFYKGNLIITDKYEKFYNIIYYLMCTSLIIQIFFSLILNKKEISFLGWDKNFTGVILFLFFAFCYKQNYLFGVILAIAPAIFLDSRGYILMLVLFFLIKLLKGPLFKVLNIFKLIKMYKVFLLMIIFICSFSFFWIKFVAPDTYVQEGINDTSNKMRFGANLKAMDLIKENNFLMFYGFDNDIKKVLGIDSPNGEEHTRYYGVRLVQTHNSLLLTMVKTGLLFSILYFLIVSKILDKYYLKENIEYIFPYLASSMIMHSLLNTSFLLFWILILHIPPTKFELRIRWPFKKYHQKIYS